MPAGVDILHPGRAEQISRDIPRIKARPSGFKKGDLVPDWLIARHPKCPGAIEGAITFDTDCTLTISWREIRVRPLFPTEAVLRINKYSHFVFSNPAPQTLIIDTLDNMMEWGPETSWQFADRIVRRALFGPFVRKSTS